METTSINSISRRSSAGCRYVIVPVVHYSAWVKLLGMSGNNESYQYMRRFAGCRYSAGVSAADTYVGLGPCPNLIYHVVFWCSIFGDAGEPMVSRTRIKLKKSNP